MPKMARKTSHFIVGINGRVTFRSSSTPPVKAIRATATPLKIVRFPTTGSETRPSTFGPTMIPVMM